MRAMLVVLIMAAWGAECAQPFSSAEVSALADAATTAVEADDVAGFRDRMRQFQRLVPCLAGPVPTRPLARLYVLDAIVRLAEDRDPGPPLAAALYADPDVGIPPFLRDRAKAAPLAGGTALGAGTRGWIDGRPVSGFPALSEPRVLQREVDGRWESVFATALPREGSLVGPIAGPRIGDGTRRALVWVGGGAERLVQDPEEAGDYVPEARATSAGLTVAGEGSVELGPGAGLWGRAALPVRLGRLSGGGLRLAPHAELGAHGAIGPLEIEVGVSLFLTPSLRGDRNRPLPDVLPLLGARVWAGAFDGGLTVAAWPDSARLRGRIGWQPGVDAVGGALRAGLEGTWARRGFVQEVPQDVRSVRTAGVELVASVGVIWR